MIAPGRVLLTIVLAFSGAGCADGAHGRQAHPAAVVTATGTTGGAKTTTPHLQRTDPAPRDRPGPVLLLPGYGGDTWALQLLATRLRRAGRVAVVVPFPDDATGDLREQATVLDRAVASQLRAGAPSVDVVGYSAGGVVARLWLRTHDRAGKVRRVVTLGSPHHGTALAGLAAALTPTLCPAACRELAPGSPLLLALDAGDETPDGPLWTSVWTARDLLVSPPTSSRLDGAIDVRLESVCPAAKPSHATLAADPLVQAIVLRAVGVAPPRPFGPADCNSLRRGVR